MGVLFLFMMAHACNGILCSCWKECNTSVCTGYEQSYVYGVHFVQGRGDNELVNGTRLYMQKHSKDYL